MTPTTPHGAASSGAASLVVVEAEDDRPDAAAAEMLAEPGEHAPDDVVVHSHGPRID